MKFCLLVFLMCYALIGVAQDPTPPSELEGLELREWLKDNWYSPWHNDLGYDSAREEMFGFIDAEGGNIECVYSGFQQAAEFTTYPDPMNTEHTVPQSFFDEGLPMRSDIHHLFPTHGQANSTRGNLPFGEVPDNQADEWIYSNGSNYQNGGSIPSSNIDGYSEVAFNEFFEPREEQKGNTARAIFYFYTMYVDEIESGLQDISSAGDLETLYTWHVMDPPDALEIERDAEIQAVQGNYNPYIRMPELAAPAWGFISSVDEYQLELQVIVDQNSETISILNDEHILVLTVLNSLGQFVITEENSSEIAIDDLESGSYILRVEAADGRIGIKKFFIHY